MRLASDEADCWNLVSLGTDAVRIGKGELQNGSGPSGIESLLFLLTAASPLAVTSPPLMEGESVFRCSPWVNYTAPPSGGSEMMPNFAELPVSLAPVSAVPEGGQSFTKFRIKLDSKSAGAPQPIPQPVVAPSQPSPVVPEFVGTWIEVQKPPERPRDDDVHSGGMLVPTNEPVGRSTPPAAAASMMNTFEIGAPGEWSQHTPKPPRKKPTKRVVAPAPTLTTFSIASSVTPARGDLRRLAPLNAQHTHERATDGERRSAQRPRPHAGDAQDQDMPDDSDTRSDLTPNSAPRPSSPPSLPISVPPASPPEQLAPLPPLRPAFATVPAPVPMQQIAATSTQPSPAPERKRSRSPVFVPQSPRPIAALASPTPPPKSVHAPSPVPVSDPPAPQPAPGPSRVVIAAAADTAPVVAQPLLPLSDHSIQVGPIPSYLPPKPHSFGVAPIIRNASAPTPLATREISAPVRRWGVAQREIRGIAGGRWFARSWAGASTSPYDAALALSRIQPASTPLKLVAPVQPSRPPVVRMPTDLSVGLAASSAVDSGAVTDDDVSMAEA